MCKSKIGACFSHLTFDGSSYITTHGCIDFLSVSERELCNASGEDFDDVIYARAVGSSETEDDRSTLVCCNTGMCNYVDTTKIEIYINTKHNESIKRKSQTLYYFLHLLMYNGLVCLLQNVYLQQYSLII